MTLIRNYNIFNGYQPIINTPAVSFRRTDTKLYPATFETGKDSFNTNPLYSNTPSQNEIIQLAKSNPRIMEILKEYNIPLKPNMKVLEELNSGHHKNTRIAVAKIYSALPENIKSEINPQNLQEAAMLHDWGKIFIPDKILNKKGSLNPEEKKIMEQHSELGAEIQRALGTNEDVVEMIKYHHQKADGSGYPNVDKNFKHNISSQILYVADKYTALTEKRCYKEPMTKEDAMSIIQKDVETGIINQEVFDALIKSLR